MPHSAGLVLFVGFVFSVGDSKLSMSILALVVLGSGKLSRSFILAGQCFRIYTFKKTEDARGFSADFIDMMVELQVVTQLDP